MKRHLTCFAAILFILVTGLTQCKKNDVTLLTGSISGNCSPAGAAARITVLKNAGTIPLDVNPGSSGSFSITGLQPGNYLVSISALPGFAAPAPIEVLVLPGENTDLGTILFTPISQSETGSISGRISPATAGVNISVRDAAGSVRYGGYSDIAGNFKIANVAAGSYVLNFTPSLSFAAPADVNATVTNGNNTDVGTVLLNTAGQKAIDTITGLVSLFTAAEAAVFINRAANDSAIVLLASFYVYRDAITPALAAAMNKIIIARSIFQLHGFSGTLTLTGLKEVAGLRIITSNDLHTVNLPALAVCGSMMLRDCPNLTNINTGPLRSMASLIINNTGLPDLQQFRAVGFRPSELNIRSNAKLSSLAGLNFLSDSIFNCTIMNNVLLSSLDGLQSLRRFTRETMISGNPALQSLTGLNNAVYARQLTLSGNANLTNVCPAKQLLTYLKTAPAFTEWQYNQITGQPTTVTRQPLTANGNGNFATIADLLGAASLCP